ncbi:MAG TPA: hypothetical protein VLM75_10845 [Spirochaetota bacterium]|nr:hypothetical protein [Spirochaetota bacterium]
MKRFSFAAIAAVPVTVIFLFFHSGPAEGAVILGETSSMFAEIRQTLLEIKDTFGGVWRFGESVSSVVRTIADLVDPRALALLFFVLLFSAGFAAIGIPRGRASFFISLSLVNALWFAWGKSASAEMFAYSLGMAAANLYLLVPYFSYLILRRWAPPLAKRALAAARSRRVEAGTATPKSREEIRFLSRRVEDECLGLLASLSGDAAGCGANDPVAVSEESKERIGRLRETLEKLIS